MFRKFFFCPFIAHDIFFGSPLSRAAFFPNSLILLCSGRGGGSDYFAQLITYLPDFTS